MMFRTCSLLLIALLCGCSNREDELIGMWMTPEFAHIPSSRITFSPDGTALHERPRFSDSRMNWKRLDQKRFTLTQAGGVTWVGCLSEDVINIRARYEGAGRERIYRYFRSGPDGKVARKKTSPSKGLTCRP
jgi:hypothetical protein